MAENKIVVNNPEHCTMLGHLGPGLLFKRREDSHSVFMKVNYAGDAIRLQSGKLHVIDSTELVFQVHSVTITTSKE